MICKKTNTEFKKNGYGISLQIDKEYCYYHNPKTIKSNLMGSTMRTMVKEGYSCKMIENFLRKKYFEMTGKTLI